MINPFQQMATSLLESIIINALKQQYGVSEPRKIEPAQIERNCAIVHDDNDVVEDCCMCHLGYPPCSYCENGGAE